MTLATSPAAAALKVVVLDVGEGQAILLKREQYGILIDTGVATSAAHVLERLDAYGIRFLDYLVLTHVHPDHVGGYFRLRKAFPKTVVIDHNHPLSQRFQPFMEYMYYRAVQQDPRRRVMKAGEDLVWRGVTIKMLSPHEFSNQNLNRHSMVLSVRFGKSKAILLADADDFVERRLVEEGAIEGPVALLVAGHHGWGNTADPVFLALVRPQITVISASWQHPGYQPDDNVVARLEAASGQFLRTDRDGEVCLEFMAEQGLALRCAVIP